MPSLDTDVLQLAVPPLRVAGLPPLQLRFVVPSMKVTEPVGVPLFPLTVALRVVVLPGLLVKTLFGLGVSDVVLDTEAAVNVNVISQLLKLMWVALVLSWASETRYRLQFPFTGFPVKTLFV